jgi:hypothetical protein
MKYVVTWRERPTDSAAEYEAAQKRVIEAFSVGKVPKGLTFHQFVARVGLGGYAVVETDQPGDLQFLATAYAPVSLSVEPVVDVAEAVVAAEMRGIEWRDLLQNN